MARIMDKAVTPDASLSTKDSTEISQAEINRIKTRYEIEEQKQKAVEDLKERERKQHLPFNNKQPMAVSGSGNSDNSNNIYNPKFSHYTLQKKQELLDQARRQLEEQKRNWQNDEQELSNSLKKL